MTFEGEMTVDEISLFGVTICCQSFEEVVETLLAASEKSKLQAYVTLTGVHGLMECQRDAQCRQAHEQALLSVPDGMPLVWLGKGLGVSQMERIYGPDLMLALLEAGLDKERRHFFLGGREGVAGELEQCLKDKFDKLKIVGTWTPPELPLTVDQEKEVVQLIRQSKPHFVWVGVGCPKQEKLMQHLTTTYKSELEEEKQGRIWLGVGAAFDFHSGKVVQAPTWVGRAGLEWLYRLCREPCRLWRRYLFTNLKFILKLLVEVFKKGSP